MSYSCPLFARTRLPPANRPMGSCVTCSVRVWQVPATQWLTGGLGVGPLAPLGDVREAGLSAVFARTREPLGRELPSETCMQLAKCCMK